MKRKIRWISEGGNSNSRCCFTWLRAKTRTISQTIGQKCNTIVLRSAFGWASLQCLLVDFWSPRMEHWTFSPKSGISSVLNLSWYAWNAMCGISIQISRFLTFRQYTWLGKIIPKYYDKHPLGSRGRKISSMSSVNFIFNGFASKLFFMENYISELLRRIKRNA